ncbi:MAG TPA: glycosyltransferase [Aquihabitans sp.]|jgi:GT2 family glycosyltransferase|nr:glycosyltransferase [Aquihabitans sp.]
MTGESTGAVTVVVATRDRREQVLASLARTTALPERPAVILVDNASGDRTPEAVRACFPEVQVIALDRNEGAVARNIGVATAATPVVAFADDDSWWAPGSLAAAARRFSDHPALGLAVACVVVGPDELVDPVSEAMAASPIHDGHDGLPGRPVLGFQACAAAVRRRAFLDVGGFSRILKFLGEEDLLAWDLADAGWALRYLDDLVVHHHPQAAGRDSGARQARQRRNALLTTWLRRPAPLAAAATARAVGDGVRDPVARRALVDAARLAPAALRARRVVGPEVDAAIRQLEAS